MVSQDDASSEDGVHKEDSERGKDQPLEDGHQDDPEHNENQSPDDSRNDDSESQESELLLEDESDDAPLLPGGYRRGDEVVSLTDFSSRAGFVAQGDVGHVIGKSSNPNAPGAELRLCCSFPGMEEVNILASEVRRRGALLAGGFRVGDEVVALVTHDGNLGSVVKGDIGTVIGPCSDPSIPGSGSRICCKFPFISEHNILDKHIWPRGSPLVGGLQIGDEVVMLKVFGFIQEGTVGVVRGPNDNIELDDAQMRVNVDFNTEAGANLLFGTDIWKAGAPLANGLVIGDEVVALVGHDDFEGHVSRGDVGVVRGPGANIALPDDEDDEENMVCSLLCQFPRHPGADLEHTVVWKRSMPVANGLRIGDEVVLLSALGENLPHGSVGLVCGPCSDKAVASGCACDFDGLVADVPAAEIWPHGKPLAGGLHVGDRVVCLVNHSSAKGTVNQGVHGTVLGPSRDPRAGDCKLRVNCEFPEHQSVNLLHMTLWRLSEPLAGGFHIGDEVVALTAYEGSEGRFERFQVGSVRGPSTKPSAADASERVNCRFPEHSNVNLHFRAIWPREAAVDSTGLQIGDEVVALADYRGSHGRVTKADMGVVTGPSTSLPSASGDVGQKVNCSFPDHENVNMLVSKLWKSSSPLAGGFFTHEQVVSLTDYAGTDGRIAKGDLGTVLGPCARAQAPDAERRVNVAFESHSNANPFHTTIVRKSDVPEQGMPLVEDADPVE